MISTESCYYSLFTTSAGSGRVSGATSVKYLPLGCQYVGFRHVILAWKWVSAHTWYWEVNHIAACCVCKPVGLILVCLHHRKIVLRQSTYVNYLLSQGILPLMIQKHGRHWHWYLNVLVQCLCLDPILWYACTFLDPSRGCSYWPWCRSRYHHI